MDCWGKKDRVGGSNRMRPRRSLVQLRMWRETDQSSKWRNNQGDVQKGEEQA